MQVDVFTPAKARHETINVDITQQNTTWFDDCQDGDVHMITDYHGCLLIRELGYYYPVLIYDVTRRVINYDPQKAKELIRLHCE